MRIDKVYIKNFKNLIEFNIDLNENEMKTVLLGQNASGKSNFIEALILIFKYLDLSNDATRRSPEFDYFIEYKVKKNTVRVECQTHAYRIQVNGKSTTLKAFFSADGKSRYQPKNVFAYYSGVSNKLKELFWDHQNRFYEAIIRPDFDPKGVDALRKLFYVQLVHSYFVLLAYFSFEAEESESMAFLKDVLGIIDLESVLFVLKMPDWAKGRVKDDALDPFWTADGLVRQFLGFLWDSATAPIYNSETVQTDFRSRESEDRLYLFVKDKNRLKALAKHYKSNTEFFKALESTYISQMISEVRIRVKKLNTNGNITFKDLSEGEQQLLTVLGLLKFTKDDESLVLLDEPDTHLNPIWKWQYLEFLESVVKRPDSTQIIINTHDPLVIGGLTRAQVRLFRSDSTGRVSVEEPDYDPKGLGVDGILTSEIFGLPTVLDLETQDLLDKRNELLVKESSGDLTKRNQQELTKIFKTLENLGIANTYRDPLFQKFIIAYKERTAGLRNRSYTGEELAAQNKIALEILGELEKESA